MSKTQTVTDLDRTTTLTFTEPGNGTQDATTGLVTPSNTAVASNVEVDLQPITGQMRKNLTGLDPQSSHVAIPIARVSGIAVEQIATDANSQRYRIARIDDWGSDMPQEIYLEKLSDPGEN